METAWKDEWKLWAQICAMAGTAVLMAVIMAVLVQEISAFLVAHGKGDLSAFGMAIGAASLIVCVGQMRPETLPQAAGKWAALALLISLQVFFASHHAAAPLMGGGPSQAERAVLERMDAQVAEWDRAVSDLRKRRANLPENYKTARHEMDAEIAGLLGRRAEAVAALAEQTDRAGTLTGAARAFADVAVIATIGMRLALEIGLILLGGMFRRMAGGLMDDADQPLERIGPDAEDGGPGGEGPEEDDGPDFVMGDATMDGKGLVLEAYPNAICRSLNDRRGPFAVYADATKRTRLGGGGNAGMAWDDAATKVLREGRAA